MGYKCNHCNVSIYTLSPIRCCLWCGNLKLTKLSNAEIKYEEYKDKK